MAQLRTAGIDIKVLEDKEVLMHFGDNPQIDRKTGTFMEGWHSAGLEPADSSWTESREVTENKTNLTGGQTATSYTAGAVSATVDLVPGSAVVDYIEWPETITKNNVLYRKHTSKVAKATVARVHKFTSNILGIKVSREKASLSIAERVSTTDPTPRSLSVAYNNGEDEVMFEEMYYMVKEDGSVAEVKPKIFVDIDDLQKEIEAGRAFVPQASESSLSAFVVEEDKTDNAVDGVPLLEFKQEDGSAAPSPQPPGTVSVKFNLAGATGGTFTVTVGDNTTSALAHDVSRSDLQAALRSAGESEATVTGTATAGFTIAKLSKKPTVDASNLTGGDFPKTVEITESP